VATAGRGEVVVPRTLSARVVDIAHALVGDRDVEVRFTGVRPGERTHEVLVSDDECARAFRRGRAWVIRPLLPSLAAGDGDDPAARLEAFPRAGLDGPYRSDGAVAELAEVAALLAGAGLLGRAEQAPIVVDS
jgi:UDP-glucose 4-epimerase